MLLAESPADVMSILSQLGSAGLAALAIWWLTNKHEKTINSITESHQKGMEMLSASLNKMEEGNEKRDSALQSVLEKKVLALMEMNQKISALIAGQKEMERRLEEVEKKAHFKSPDSHLAR